MSETPAVERVYSLAEVDYMRLWGENDRLWPFVKRLFPKLRLMVRGEMLKAVGPEEELDWFGEKLQAMLAHYDRMGRLTENAVMQIMESGSDAPGAEVDAGVLVHGRNGLLVKARTAGQQRLVEAIASGDLVFAVGPAGTGKTYTAVAMAVRALKNKEVRRIVLTRPAVEAGESLGFLPGDMRDKLDPYLQPLYDALRDMIPQQKLLSHWEDGTIEIAPLAYMRGRTLDNAFVILDEAQNATSTQLRMFLTRMGRHAKFVVTGDLTQVDLPRRQQSGLPTALRLLEGIEGIGIVRLDHTDVVRHRLVSAIVRAYEREAEIAQE
ncbi:MAG: PhoH family protein [Bacteroidales bacterium]|nr:PhoH family protein [Bacteroidales bacterium]